MKRVLILQNKILHYRKPLYNKLAEKYDITVLHSGHKSVEDCDLYKEKIVRLKSVFGLKFQFGVVQEVKKGDYHAVVAMLDIRWLNNLLASYVFPKNVKFIWWGIMISGNGIGNKLRALILRRGLPAIFYTKQGIKDMQKYGVKGNQLTYCNNTIHIENRVKCYEFEDKSSILFVGSLDTRKRIDTLISAFHTILDKIGSKITIDIIGDGSEKESIIKQIKDLNLTNRVFLHGQINNTDNLVKYYKNAICSVSYGQAGLAVLQSMGYGVPFITKENAISGGEITNISHNINGFICDNHTQSLSKYILELCTNSSKAQEMGKAAYQHYTDYCSIENMANSFSKSIEN